MKLIMQDNGFCKGVELKRRPTEEETIYCLNEILGFDYDYALSDLKYALEHAEDEDEAEFTIEEFDREKKEICDAFADFITGDCEWRHLCDVLYCYDDIDTFSFGIYAKLLVELEEKRII